MTSAKPRRQALVDLLERVKGAEGADREIDAGLAYLFDDHRYGFSKEPVPLNELGWLAARYSASLDAALALVERVLPGLDVEVWSFKGRGWGGSLSNQATYRKRIASHRYCPTPALALLSALLTALLSQEEDA